MHNSRSILIIAEIRRLIHSPQDDMSLLLVEDELALVHWLERALEAAGFVVSAVPTIRDALQFIENSPPAFAVVDLRLPDGNGLDVVAALNRRRSDSRSVVLTGYGSIASAVAAVKLGARNYLTKPAEVGEIIASLRGDSPSIRELPERVMSPDRVRWEHICRVLESCNHDLTETARRLGMHRRTLQRMLSKRAPR